MQLARPAELCQITAQHAVQALQLWNAITAHQILKGNGTCTRV